VRQLPESGGEAFRRESCRAAAAFRPRDFCPQLPGQLGVVRKGELCSNTRDLAPGRPSSHQTSASARSHQSSFSFPIRTHSSQQGSLLRKICTICPPDKKPSDHSRLLPRPNLPRTTKTEQIPNHRPHLAEQEMGQGPHLVVEQFSIHGPHQTCHRPARSCSRPKESAPYSRSFLPIYFINDPLPLLPCLPSDFRAFRAPLPTFPIRPHPWDP